MIDNEIHVWLAGLDSASADPRQFEAILSMEERARAALFHFQKDKDRFIAGRALLRIFLGRYLDREPSRLSFAYSDKGKPQLSGAESDSWLCFNLSHSGGTALFGFSRDRLIGVDIERLRPIPDALRIAESYFSSGEKTFLRASPPGEIEKAFLTLWTQKEAYLKACGDGLSRPLDEIEILPTRESSPIVIRVPNNPSEAKGWMIRSFTPNPDSVAALAAKNLRDKTADHSHLNASTGSTWAAMEIKDGIVAKLTKF